MDSVLCVTDSPLSFLPPSLEQKAIDSGLLGVGSTEEEMNEQLMHAFYEIPSNRPTKEVEEEVCAHLAM